MQAEIFKEFRFEAAHRLPHVQPGHKCYRLHGHSFVVQVHVLGEVNEHAGWVCDFSEIATAWQPLHQQLDHFYLNEVVGLANPTSENLARWCWMRLRDSLPGLSKVVVQETCSSGCTYMGQ